ncbi:MAG: A/G-specific adenine glycosylase [Alphaproteobacteria bacterium]|nr:A/G-specific adenine glycosylase [Alphaproteobacteria bacterium]
MAPALLDWYDRHRRTLPWRAAAGERPDPYRVWLSEIMLQQTTVATVGPYFLKFIRKWPTLKALAKADLDEVLIMWAGLGYYRRARGLHACAQDVLRDHGGVFPSSEEQLLSLSGIGPYTAAAIAAIAFDQKANVVDGNVERVMARLHRVAESLPAGKKKLKQLAATHLPESRFGDYAQSLMDLGATICTPRNPKCASCPLASVCEARAAGDPELYPRRAPKAAKPVRHTTAFVLKNKDGAVLLRQRPHTGLLAGMMEVPSTPWESKPLDWAAARRYAPVDGSWESLPITVRHVFTHFDLTIQVAVLTAQGKKESKIEGRFVPRRKWDDEALPSVMRKVLEAVCQGPEGKGRE